VIPAEFEYSVPKTVPEAIALLQSHTEAKVLAGGFSLVPLMKLRLATPPFLVDIGRIPQLDYISEDGGFLRIGAMATEAELEASPVVRQRYRLLIDTSRVIADPLVRNMATVGGNVAHADPANDHPAAMLAMNAIVVATGPNGERTIPITSFFVDTFQTALQPAELLTEIRVPTPPALSGGAYVKLERKVGDYAIVGVAAQVTLAEGGGRFLGAFGKRGPATMARVGIGLTNVGPIAVKATQAEQALLNQEPTEDVLQHAATLAAQASSPETDLRGPAEYKRDMVRALTLRALRRALERAQGGAS
jgi:carbon-monoxide dehydrogenase medium subunit